jgi:hypothetical protein
MSHGCCGYFNIGVEIGKLQRDSKPPVLYYRFVPKLKRTKLLLSFHNFCIEMIRHSARHVFIMNLFVLFKYRVLQVKEYLK